jgi:hypothetical protein
MKYPTLFELLRQEPLEIYNAQKLKYPAIAENFYNALSDKYFVGQLTLNDCTNICACCNVSYLFTYSTIHDLFHTYTIVDNKAVINE